MDIDEISTRTEPRSDAHPDAGTQANRLAQEARQAAQDAKAAVAREMDDARTRAAEAARQIRDGARHAGDRVGALLSEQTERQKAEVAESLRAVAQTLRDAGRDQPGALGARMVDEAAWRLEDVSSRLDERSVGEMAEDVADFGRRNPGLFLAGCLAAGFAAGRFLTSGSADGRPQPRTQRDHGEADHASRRDPGDSDGAFGTARPDTATNPAPGFGDYAAHAMSGRQASAWATGTSGGASGAAPATGAEAGGTETGGAETGGTDVNDARAQGGVASDARAETGFPADAASEDRAPFGSGPASEGIEPEGSRIRGGGRDGGF